MTDTSNTSIQRAEIELDSLSFSYRNQLILDNISFKLEAGESAALIGANGSGKSTLLSILSGVRKCSRNNASFKLTKSDKTVDLFKDRKSAAKYIGYVPQDDPLMPELTVKDNLLLWSDSPASRLSELLEGPALKALDISTFLNKPVKALSGGMRRRVTIACAMINSPDILILDEPASALDLNFRAEIRNYLDEFHRLGGTFILSTHDEADLDICNKILLLKDCHLSAVPNDLRGEKLLEQLKKSNK